jgi:predicted Zn-ribbon and HTH transcriptional regulator
MSSKILGSVIIPSKRGIRIQCKCGYRWTYSGIRILFASCPKCHSTITLQPKRNQQQQINKNGGAV